MPHFTRTAEGVFLASSAIVVGDVRMAAGVNIWFGAVVRGDVAPITLGENANLQDGAIAHCDFGVPLIVEANVVVGHAAVLHGARIGAGSLIGIGAKLLTGSVIGEECIIAAGCVVPPGMIVPPRSLVMGLPGRVIRSVSEEDVVRTRTISARYLQLAAGYCL